MSKIQTIRKFIFYFLLFAAMIWIMIMYRDYSAMLPFYMFIMIFAIEGIPFFIFVIRGVKVSIRVERDMQQYSGRFEFHVRVSNKSIYPFKMVHMKIKINRKYGNEAIYRNIEIPLNGKQKQDIIVSANRIGCGYIEIKAESVYIYDILGVFGRKYRKLIHPVEVVLLPTAQEMFIDLEQVPYIEVDESDVFSKDRAGDDTSETFGIREFVDGDSLNKIHWKLSARMNDTMVREFSMPVETNVYVYVDLYQEADIDAALQNSISAAYALMGEEVPFFMCWFDETDMCMRRQLPKSFEEIDDIMCRVMRLNLFYKNPATDEILNRFSNEFHVVYPVFKLPASS